MRLDREKIRNPKSRIRNRICSGCGAEARRINAKYCLVCAKLLKEDYQPLDSLRSSNRLQGRGFLVENVEREEVADLFERNENTVSHTAWASFVYSMVPYLGILFIPFTLITGVFGYAVSVQKPELGGRKLAVISIGMSFIVLGIQIFLWWLLYMIPEMVGI